jgi:hypothetical protein
MKISGNENTVLKLYKLGNKKDIANLEFKENTVLSNIFKDKKIRTLEVIIDKSLSNNDIQFIDNNNKVILETSYEVLENSLI